MPFRPNDVIFDRRARRSERSVEPVDLRLQIGRRNLAPKKLLPGPINANRRSYRDTSRNSAALYTNFVLDRHFE